MSKSLKVIQDNPDLLVSYEQGIAFLERSYILSFLRERAVVNITDGGSDVQISAAEAHRSLGYSQALDDLVNFKERYILPANNNKAFPVADYGGVSRAFEQDDLLPEEVDAIRNNTKPKYSNPTSTQRTNLNK